MSLLPIRLVPDAVLRIVCARVLTFDDALRGLAADMLETMYDAPGRGLAAPQIGVPLRLFVMDVDWKTGTPAPQVFVNPVISERGESLVVFDEGCLSIPGTVCSVERPADLKLRWQDLDGTPHAARFDGFAARCIQHEVDHLDGVLCTDYPAPVAAPA